MSDCGFKLFTDAVAAGGVVKAICVPNGSRIANSALKAKGDVFEQAVTAGGLGLVFARLSVVDGAAVLEAPKAVKEAFAGREEKLVRARNCVRPSIRCIT